MAKHSIECPKCHEVFQVDEAGYATIVKQIRNKESSKEPRERETQFEKVKENAPISIESCKKEIPFL